MTENNDLQGIGTRALDNPTHYQLMKNTVDNAKSDKNVMKLASSLVADLEAAVQEEERVLKTPQKDPLTDQIKQADADRDADYAFIRDMVKAQLKNRDEHMQQGAETIYLLIKNYGIKLSDQYDRENGLMENFLNDAERKYAAEFALLGLTDALKALRTHNNQVIQLLIERSKGKSQLTTGAMPKARAAVDDAFHKLRKAINGLLSLGNDVLIPFVNLMNTEINRIKQQVLHKHGVEVNGGGDSDNNSGGGGEEEPPQG
ncbi:MAG: DUF6261 family protein [Prevotellaceae bacterium]|jgi:hypothetical protein|nr:DUF6261 family protein [Prevotellaceae bacterium]